MKQNEQGEYLSPKIEMRVIKVEKGFALSNMEPIDPDKPEQKW